jgi:hypothetical protein
MPNLLAHTIQTGTYLVLGGLLLVALCQFWSWVIAAKRGILWFLAMFFLSPVAWIVFVFVEPRSLRPLFGWLVGLGIFYWGFQGLDEKLSPKDFAEKAIAVLGLEKKKAAPEKEDTAAPPLEENTLYARKVRLRVWKAKLQAKQAALRPGDDAAKAAFDRELDEYQIEFEKVKAESARTPEQP